MLDKKDKIIFEQLLHNCRTPTVQLARLTHLSQPSIVYRIRRLEKKGCIAKYDAIINHQLLPVLPEFFFVRVPKKECKHFEQEIEEMSFVTSLLRLIDPMNYFLFTFMKDKERERLVQYLNRKKYLFSSSTMKLIKFLQFSAFGKISLTKKRMSKRIPLEKKDAQIMNVLSDGGGRDSLLEIARKTKLTYDVVLYRFKRLLKNNYFPLFICQPGSAFSLQTDILMIKSKDLFTKVCDALETTGKAPYVMQLDKNFFLTQLLTENFVEFKQALESVHENLSDSIEEMKVYHVKNWKFINRINYVRFVDK